MYTLQKYIKSTSSILQKWIKNSNTILDVVIGNQAADCDSINCSIVYAYMNYCKSIDNNHIYIPMMTVDKDKMHLRNEVMRLFQLTNIDYKDLQYISDYISIMQKEKNRILLHLVDHNVLSPQFDGFENCVSEIIDHRKDEQKYPQASRFVSYFPSIGKGVGSCSTLITQRLQSLQSLQSSQSSQPSQPSQQPIPSLSECAILLEGTILIDTMNLTPTIHKTTQDDIDALQWLETKRIQSDHLNQNQLFELLCNAKYDQSFWDTLSAQEILEYDYKDFSMGSFRIGWSAALTELNKVVNRNDFEIAFKQFIEKKQVDGMILSSVLLGEPARREIAFYATNKEKETDFWKRIQSIEVMLKDKYHCNEDPSIKHTWNTTDTFSRKGIAPILASFF